MATIFADPASNGEAFAADPRPMDGKRVRLESIDRIRHELGKLYVEARDGDRDTVDFSRLANGLSILARLVTGGDVEQRLEALHFIAGR